ncbi:hypothetical protein AMS68_005180 [Peltaster fructicola]|uniref:G-patch domain-containing protein n=1 Tax=Peltaster fructicola TaxID=286661 RepID=A0A6H0XY30_9PEZI|nr:hypothetical protein AMS68_005180 [Peltaster fructicola]
MSDDEYEIPLVDQRYFGAGIKRKRIRFVTAQPAQDKESSLSRGQLTAEKYLAIVMGPKEKCVDVAQTNESLKSRGKDEHQDIVETNSTPTSVRNTLCKTCLTYIDLADPQQHELSREHQRYQSRVRPSYHIDRQSKAFAMLQAQGWDPDEAPGLGPSGEGLTHPIIPSGRPERLGLGANPAEEKAKPKPAKLDVKQSRELAEQTHREKAKLWGLFNRSEELDKYLGTRELDDYLGLR